MKCGTIQAGINEAYLYAGTDGKKAAARHIISHYTPKSEGKLMDSQFRCDQHESECQCSQCDRQEEAHIVGKNDCTL